MSDWLMCLIFIYAFINIGGIVLNIKLLDYGEETVFKGILDNNMNLFGKILLTLLLLIFCPVWTVLELIVRLFKWLCYLGK
jgi:hypothetical protein